MAKSVYHIIKDNLNEDGLLPSDFCLRDKLSVETDTEYTDGAMDGIAAYHIGPREPDDEALSQLAVAIKCMSAGKLPEAEGLFSELTGRFRAIFLADKVQKYIIDNSKDLNPDNVLKSAVHFFLYSTNIECVKIGMEILELLQLNDKLEDMIRTIGLCNEFTLFAVWHMLQWENGNTEVFDLAKKVHGWGRIHAIERLEPETDEIRSWLLTEGVHNDVSPAYSALACWDKSGAETILFGDPTYDEFTGIAAIINALADEGPCKGLSALENAEQILTRFLEVSENFDLSPDDYAAIKAVYDWSDINDSFTETAGKTAYDILHSVKCTVTIENFLPDEQALILAEELGIPYKDALLGFMKKDFDKYSSACDYMIEDAKYRDAVLDLFRENLNFETLKGDLSTEYLFDFKDKENDRFFMILQALANAPFCGNDFILTALSSPYVIVRSRAVSDIAMWLEGSDLLLKEEAPELYAALQSLHEAEPDEELKETITGLL